MELLIDKLGKTKTNQDFLNADEQGAVISAFGVASAYSPRTIFVEPTTISSPA